VRKTELVLLLIWQDLIQLCCECKLLQYYNFKSLGISVKICIRFPTYIHHGSKLYAVYHINSAFFVIERRSGTFSNGFSKF
jgi:hypothetical protein